MKNIILFIIALTFTSCEAMPVTLSQYVAVICLATFGGYVSYRLLKWLIEGGKDEESKN